MGDYGAYQAQIADGYRAAATRLKAENEQLRADLAAPRAATGPVMVEAIHLLTEFRETLPTGHHEIPGVIRAIEVLRDADRRAPRPKDEA